MINDNKNTSADKGIGGLIVLLVFSIVGVILLQSIGNAISPVINTGENVNESLDLTLGALDVGFNTTGIDVDYGYNLTDDDVIAVSSVTNGTAGDNDTQTYVEDTDYTVNNTANNIYFLNSSDMKIQLTNLTNTTYITYTYRPTNYVESSSARVLTNLITLFFAIGILISVVGIVRKMTGYV